MAVDNTRAIVPNGLAALGLAVETVGSNARGAALTGGVIYATVSGGTLTVALKTMDGQDPSPTSPVFVSFYNQTTKDYETTAITAATSITAPSAATIGALGGYPFRLWLAGLLKNDVFRLGLINCYGSPIIKDHGTISALEISSSSSSSSVVYANAQVISANYRPLGNLDWESGLPAVGVWSAEPSPINPYFVGGRLPGDVVRYDNGTVSVASQSGSTVIPYDDTIPELAEGDQCLVYNALTGAVSPCNMMEFEAAFHASYTVMAKLILSLFFGSEIGALRVTVEDISAAHEIRRLVIRDISRQLKPGDSVYQVRIGGSTAGTWRINGSDGARKLGGKLMTHVRAWELMG